ncbi:ABC transporter permease [Nocardioides sp. 1609]|uniref:ABC transporter permease n=1 Tax=Nocardioides sp. 1609 TaxID=2508327 RepID=UPI0010706986|nr:ABC transporter permease [Nocardioides sp. 1609]
MSTATLDPDTTTGTSGEGPTRVFPTLVSAHRRAAARDVTTIFFTFAFPLIFLLLFGSIFSGQDVEESGKSYIQYIAPGVLTWGVANAAVFSIAFALMQWRESDLLRIIRMTPTRVGTLLSSKLAIALVIALVQTALFVGVAMVPFFGLRPAASSWEALPLLALGVVTFFALGAVIGSVTNTAESVAAVSNVIMLPMAFLSGSFFPLDMMPDWLQKVAQVFPLYYLNDGVGHALNGTGSTSDVLLSLGVLAGFAVVFAAVAVKVFRWSND